jgi:hypothetical protein
VTLAGLVVQERVTGTLGDLERTPAGLHGEWWRWLTSVVVLMVAALTLARHRSPVAGSPG